MATRKKTTQTKTEASEVKVEGKVKAFMRMTWPGLGKAGEVIELSPALAKEYAQLGIVDLSQVAIDAAQK